MKYLKKYKLFESVSEQEIHNTCKEYNIINYTINSDGSIDVDGNVDLNDQGLTRLPVKFSNISGYFDCDYNQLTSLECAPTSVGGDFYCSNNNLTSLEGAPNSVGGHFWCSNNNLASLEGLEWKSFGEINLLNNPVYPIVKDWINNEDRIELIEYFIDMNVIQDTETDKPKLILPRLEAFHEDMELEMDINLEKVKKYYEIIK